MGLTVRRSMVTEPGWMGVRCLFPSHCMWAGDLTVVLLGIAAQHHRAQQRRHGLGGHAA